MLSRKFSLAACVLLAVIGCSSISSTMLTRDESNRFWTRKGDLKGVPITLKVPTHVQLTVFERHFMVKGPVKVPGEEPRARRVDLPFVIRDFSQEFIYTEKIFTVDYKHPASGTYNLHLDLTDDQYIKQFQHDVSDTTIADVTKLVKGLVPANGLGALQAKTAGAIEQETYEIQSVVAVRMFEIDAPDFEEQMSEFLNCHLNQAHDAWVAPPSVPAVHRTGLSGFEQPSNICEGVVVPHAEPIPDIKFNCPQIEQIPMPPPKQAIPPPIPPMPQANTVAPQLDPTSPQSNPVAPQPQSSGQGK
jgi:hypothetical protein